MNESKGLSLLLAEKDSALSINSNNDISRVKWGILCKRLKVFCLPVTAL